MKITRKTWLIFILTAFLFLLVWYRFGYPRLSFIRLEVDRSIALDLAKHYLRGIGGEPDDFHSAIEFRSDQWADRYLQQTLRLGEAEKFVERYRYDIFIWYVRFFREQDKEEYILRVSPRSGEVVYFQHLIDDIAPRPPVDEEQALLKAKSFLLHKFGFDFNDYTFHEKKIKRYEQRIDYTFWWEKKNVYIPWRKEQGGAKLLTSVTVSGEEVREFIKQRLDIPEKFERYVESQFVFADSMYSFYFFMFIVMIGISVSVLIKKRAAFVVRGSKRFYIYLAGFFLLINAAYVFNNWEAALIRYPTSSRLVSFFGVYIFKFIADALFMTVMFLIPGLSGEALRREEFPDNDGASFSRFIQSSFLNRGMCASVIFGYLVFFIMLGLQSAVFYYGQKYLGVWKEWIKMAQFSSAYIPFVTAFALAASASLTEEIVFRLFGISLLKKYTRNTLAAILIMGLVWGLGHSQYAIFPVWFRACEVSLIGILFGFIYVRWGLIPLLVAHYLFDAFWGIAPHLLGHATPLLFAGALSLFIIPLIFAGIAFIKNKSAQVRLPSASLDKIQQYNLNLLVVYLHEQKNSGLSAHAAKAQLLEHNWDIDLIEIALNKVFGVSGAMYS